MAGRRSCVNSLWSGTERVRIGERLKSTLAGVLELELLRCKHLEMVDAALVDKSTAPVDQRERGNEKPESAASDNDKGSATSRRQQDPSPSDMAVLPSQSSPLDSGTSPGEGAAPPRRSGCSNSRWSTLSWDAPSDLLSPPTPDPSGTAQPDSDSRPSSGFYSVSGSSLSDSCYSVSSEAAQWAPGPLARPLRLWEQGPLSGDQSDTQWQEGALQRLAPCCLGDSDEPEQKPVSGDLEVNGLSFLLDLCSSFGDLQPASLLALLDPTSSSSSSLNPRSQLDPRYCTDLVSRRTKEVYAYPSPLHAVALQSPLFNSHGQESSPSPSPEGPQTDDPSSTIVSSLGLRPPQSPAPASFTHLEQYISRLARQYHSRVASSTSDLTAAATPGPVTQRGLRTPGKGHGSTQSLSAFESRSAGGSLTPCKSLLGNSARVSLSSIGKKASRNSINLGNLPSVTGEDLNISLHLNLNLNLAPGLNSNLGLMDSSRNGSRNGSCGALKSDFVPASTSSSTSLSSCAQTPGVRPRPRISTCPSSLSHRSSLEVTPGSGPGTSSGMHLPAFSRSLDWSSGAASGAGLTLVCSNPGSASGSQRSSLVQEPSSSPKLSEDSAMVEEISRLSGLSRAVVVGLMEQGVELDVDCFQTDVGEEKRGRGQPSGHTPCVPMELSREHSRVHLRGASTDLDLNPQRPIQLSLSVTHSPQSNSGLTPPLSRSPQSQSSLTPPLSYSPLSHSSSPVHPYTHSIPNPTRHYSASHFHHQHTPSTSDPPSSTTSSPASRPSPRGHSPPRPLQPSPLGPTPLSVFRRDAPFQCSLPRVSTGGSPLDSGIRPRGGSLRQAGGGSSGGGNAWKRADREGLYRGKHVSRELVRASTVSSFARKENYCPAWVEEEQQTAALEPRRSSSKLWRGFEGRLWGKEPETDKEEMDREEYGYGWRRNNSGSWREDHQRVKVTSSSKGQRPRTEGSPNSSKRKGKGSWERRSSSLRLSRRTLFRSESQGLLEPQDQRKGPSKGPHWVSSLDVGRGGLELSVDDGVRPLGRRKEDKGLSSTASLFNLSHSQSLEGSCHSLSSPLSSPSFSPSPPPRAPLQRSRSLRDLGRRVFGSMRSLSLKRKTCKK